MCPCLRLIIPCRRPRIGRMPAAYPPSPQLAKRRFRVWLSLSRHRSITSTRTLIWGTPTPPWRRDAVARHQRQRGEDVFFLTGTDEHGGNVARAAEAAGLPPKEFCDQVSARFRRLAGAMESSHDYFIRTTDPEHERRVQDVRPAPLRHRSPLRGHLRRPLLQLLRGLLHRSPTWSSRATCARSTTAPSSGSRRRTGSSRSRSGRRACSSCTTPTPSSSAPAPATTRRAR